MTIFRCLNKQRGACNGTQSGQYLTPSQLTRSSHLGGGNLFGCVFTFCSFDNRLWFWGRLWRCAQSWRRSRPSRASTSDRQVLLLVPCWCSLLLVPSCRCFCLSCCPLCGPPPVPLFQVRVPLSCHRRCKGGLQLVGNLHMISVSRCLHCCYPIKKTLTPKNGENKASFKGRMKSGTRILG